MADSKLTEEHAPNAENQGYSTTQYSVNQGNWQEQQGYNIGYQNDSNQGHAPNNVQFVENHGYQTTQGSNNGSVQNDVQPAASQGYSAAQYGGIQENWQGHQGYNNTLYQNDFQWYYKDLLGNEKGPYTSAQMIQWYRGNFFPPDVPVRRVVTIDHEFIPLNVMIQWYQGRVPFTPGQLAVGNQGYSTTQYGRIQENWQEHQGYNIGYQSDSNQGHAPNVGNQGYSTTQYGRIQGNWQEHQGYNIGYQSDSNQGHAPNAENQGYSTTQYSVNQGNWQQEHQGYNIGYQNDSSQGHAPNNVQFVENHGYQTTQCSNNGSDQNDVQPAASQGYQNAQHNLAAENVENENPVNVQNMLEPIHLAGNSQNGKWKCPYCPYETKQKCNVTAHIKRNHLAAENVENENPVNAQNMLEPIHLAGNSQNGKWKCPYCPYETKQKCSVTAHIKGKHLGIRKYKCEECSEAFQTQSVLNKHMMTHTGEKPFACPHCDYRATQKSCLEVHLTTHTGEKPFACPHCDHRAAKKSNMTQHIKNAHGGN